MTDAEARQVVSGIGYTLACIETERQRARESPPIGESGDSLIDEAHVAIGGEVERLVRNGHADKLAQLGAAVERWRK